jgi:hypothetical protein
MRTDEFYVYGCESIRRGEGKAVIVVVPSIAPPEDQSADILPAFQPDIRAY